ncbi:hypothetical protein D3C87_2131370 [compost metagenome]
MANLQLFQQGLHLLIDLGRGKRAAIGPHLQFEHGADVLFDRQAAEHGRILGQV